MAYSMVGSFVGYSLPFRIFSAGIECDFFTIIDFTDRRYIMGKNLVIVGGGAGGPSTAAEAKRRDPSLNVTILERGEFVSFTA